MRFLAERDGHTRMLDVTETIKMMYDALINSMDWGSEFLDTETKAAVLAIGSILGAELPSIGDEHKNAKKAGFTEPMPTEFEYEKFIKGSTEEREYAYGLYKAWHERQKAAVDKWTREVAAEELAKLMEV